MTDDGRSAGARRAARLSIAAVDVLLLAAAAWLGGQVWEAWGLWQVRVAQAGVAQQVAEDVINADDPLLGWKHVPGRAVPMPGLGEGAVWAINANGFRGERDHGIEPPAGQRRIVALGDSFTFGNVAYGDTWPARLETLLADTQVVNMGASAYGVDQMYLWYREDGAALQADLVVLALIDADLRRAQLDRWMSGHGRPFFRLVDDELVLTNVPVPPRIAPDRPLTGSWGFARFLATRIVQGEEEVQDPEVPFRIVEAFGELVRSLGREPLVLWLPHLREPDGRIRDATAARCERAGIPFLDATPAFAEASEGGDWRRGPWFRDDGHYNPAGNAVLAEAVAAWLQTRGWSRAEPEAP